MPFTQLLTEMRAELRADLAAAQKAQEARLARAHSELQISLAAAQAAQEARLARVHLERTAELAAEQKERHKDLAAARKKFKSDLESHYSSIADETVRRFTIRFSVMLTAVVGAFGAIATVFFQQRSRRPPITNSNDPV